MRKENGCPKDDKCKCDEEKAPLDQCPYSAEIGDGSLFCNCCKYCRQQCAEDI